MADLSHNQSTDSRIEELVLETVENAIDYVETAAGFLRRDDPLKWKWFATAIHDALYAFSIASLMDFGTHAVLRLPGAPYPIMYKRDSKEKWKRMRLVSREAGVVVR